MCEHRPLRWFQEVGSNMRSLGQEIREDATEASRGNDPIKFAMAPVVGAARVVLKGPTNLLLGVLDKKAETHTGYETGHTVKEAAKELVTLHPLRAAVHAVNIPDSMILDGLRLVGGYQGTTRARVRHALHEHDARMAA